MRTIDADELLDFIRMLPVDLGHREVEDIKNHIEEMLKIEQEPQWIPCSEQLPEEDGGRYLVTSYCESIKRSRIHVSYCYMNHDGLWSDVFLGYRVIAWMPLPEPYKGGDDNA